MWIVSASLPFLRPRSGFPKHTRTHPCAMQATSSSSASLLSPAPKARLNSSVTLALAIRLRGDTALQHLSL